MQSLSGYGRSAAGYSRAAAEGAYGYGRSAAEGAYGYGQVAARTVLDHPLPYALIGAGIAWLLLSGRGADERRRRPYEAMRYYAGRGGGEIGGGYDRGYGGAGYAAGGGYGGAGRTGTASYGGTSVYEYGGGAEEEDERVEDLASRAHAAGSAVGRADDEDEEAYQGRVYAARGQALGLARNVGETLGAFRERVDAALAAAGERYARWRDRAAAAASRLGAQGQDAAQGLYGYGRDAAVYVQDQPWAMALLGLGAGALLAALLPPSRYERELMRDVGDDVRERFRGVAEGAMESASRVAREVMGAAREAAEREGLTDVELPSASGLAHAARERVQDAASRVRSVVEETAAAGRAAVERELGGGENGSGGGGSGSGGATTGGTTGTGTGIASGGAGATGGGTGTGTSGQQAGKDAGKSSSSQVGGGTTPAASGGSGVGSSGSTTTRGA